MGPVNIGTKAVGVHDITISHVEAAGNTWNVMWKGDQYCFNIDTAPKGWCTNITLSYCVAHDMLGGLNTGGIYNLIVDHCEIYDTGDDGNPAGSHANAWQMWGGGTLQTMRYSSIHDTHIGMTLEMIAAPRLICYGNVFLGSPSVIIWNAWSTSVDCIYYNNAFVNCNVAFKPDGSSYYDFSPGTIFRNNIMWNSGTAGLASGSQNEDYDWSGDSGTADVIKGAHSIQLGNATQPFVTLGTTWATSDFHIPNATGATKPRNNGVAIANFGGQTFTLDRDGNTRGADGAWDMGAYEALKPAE